MQIFGKFLTNFDMDYLVEHYIYVPSEDEEITTKELEILLKKKRKHVAGTIFLYNPTMAPVGFKNDSYLKEQGFEQYGEYVELVPEAMSFVLLAGVKHQYKGKLIEIKYLFGLNKPNIEPTLTLEEFDVDLDKLNSSQLTRYDKTMNYQDVPNIRLSGKFVFFAMGHKYDRHHKNIISYARSLPIQAKKLGKDISFMYDNNYDAKESEELAYFLSPLATGKVKEKRANGFKEAFSTVPPHIVKIV